MITSLRTNIALAAVVFVISTASSTPAQDQSWIQPTEEHKLLQKDVGTWDANVKLWAEAGAEPMTSKATEKNELLKGGMWLVSHFEGEFGGMRFTGLGTYGYDPTEKKYVGSWVDTMSPYMMVSKGDYDEATKTLTMTGEGRDPMTNKVTKSKLISRFTDDDNRVFEMHMSDDDGKLTKVMEITYKRRGK